jgi:MFS family permease
MNSNRASSPRASEAALIGPRPRTWVDARFRTLLLVQFAFGYSFSALLLAPKYAAVAFGADSRTIGQLGASYVLAAAACAPIAGRLLDRGHHRTAILAGSLLLALSVGWFGTFERVEPLLYVVRSLQGIGNTLVMGGAFTLVTKLVPARDHGRAFGWVGSASLVMNGIAAYATERLSELFGWAPAFFVAGVASLVSFAFALTLPADSQPASPASSPDSRAKTNLRIPPFVLFGALAATGFAFATLSTFVQPYALVLGEHQVSEFFIGYTLTALSVRLLGGSFADRFSRRHTSAFALVIYVLSLVLAARLGVGGLFPLGLCFGLAHGMAWPSLNALVVEQAEPTRVGSALSFMQAFFGIGSIAAVLGVGHLVGPIGYPSCFGLAALLALASALSLVVRPRLPRPEPRL